MTDDDVKPGEEEEEPKEGGTLSDGVLDAFEEAAPVDPLEEDIVDIDALADKEDEDALDYDPDEW
jgi:hypothetical protein